MQRNRLRMVITLVVTGLALVGCAKTASSEESGDKAATLEAVPGSDIQRVTVAKQAAKRLGLQLAAVEAVVAPGSAVTLRAIPYGAVVYGADGKTWVYTSPTALTYVRAPITVADIDRGRAILSDGPEVGTEVVTVGTAELFGAEQEIGA